MYGGHQIVTGINNVTGDRGKATRPKDTGTTTKYKDLTSENSYRPKRREPSSDSDSEERGEVEVAKSLPFDS